MKIGDVYYQTNYNFVDGTVDTVFVEFFKDEDCENCYDCHECTAEEIEDCGSVENAIKEYLRV